jgi:WD40 repeat protein
MTIYVRDMRLLPVFTVFFFALLIISVPAAASPAEGGFIRSYDLGHGAVTMLSMTSDGSFLSAATQDGSILMLSRNAGPVWTYYNTKSNSRNSVAAIHPLGTKVIGASGTALYFISDTGQELWSDQRTLQSSIYDVAFSTDGYGYTTGGNNLYFFSKDDAPLFNLKTASAVWRFAISPDGGYVGLGTSDPDHRIYLYDRNESLHWTYDPGSAVSDVDVAYKNARVAAGAGPNLYVFSGRGELIGAYNCGSPLNGVSISRDGTRIAVGLQDGSVKVISDAGLVLWQNQTLGRVYDVALSSDGTQLAVATDSSVRWFAPDIPAMNPTPAASSYTGVPGTGAVGVSSLPAGANVFVDNTYQGIAPLTVTGLAPGEHVLLLKQAGYADWSTTITVIPDTTIALSGTLTAIAPSPTHSPAPVAAIAGALAVCGFLVTRSRKP